MVITKISEIVFGVDLQFYTNGRLLDRNYKEKYCPVCKEQMYPFLRNDHGRWRLESEKQFADKGYCCCSCAGEERGIKAREEREKLNINVNLCIADDFAMNNLSAPDLIDDGKVSYDFMADKIESRLDRYSRLARA